MTVLVVLFGAGLGVGGWLILIGLRPRPVRLDKAFAGLEPGPQPTVTHQTQAGGWAARLGTPVVRVLTRAGLPTARSRRDLATLGKPVDVHLAGLATAAVTGLILPPTVGVLLALGGIRVGPVLPAVGGLILAAVSAAAIELGVRADAAKHRAAFQHALGSFLDLVVVSLAGGAGVDQALDDAASVGHGPAYAELRYALAEARLARIPPWDTLAALGARIGVDELQQLAATVALAGSEGAKVRASLRSRATALRTRQLTAAEGEASAATERMSLPIVLLFTGFLIFVGYPAVSAVLTGF